MKAARILVWAVLGQLVLLTATGIYLYFEYRPESSGIDVFSGVDARIRIARLVRAVHRIDALLVVLTLLALPIVVLVERLVGAAIVRTRGRSWSSASLPPSRVASCRGTNSRCGPSLWAQTSRVTRRLSAIRSGSLSSTAPRSNVRRSCVGWLFTSRVES